MAWLQSLAGRAEDLLNKIDQNAATVLNDKTTEDEALLTGIITEPSGLNEITPDPIKPELELEALPNTLTLNDLAAQDESVSEGSAKLEKPLSNLSSSQNSFIMSEDVENFTETINRLELENQDLHKQLLNLQHLLLELRNENANLQSQVETSNYTATVAQTEMEKYKARIQKLLHEKETKKEPLEKFDNTLSNYNEELKKELEIQQNENIELTDNLKKVTQEISFLQNQIVLLQNNSHHTQQTLQQSLAREKKIRMGAEEECRLKTYDLQLKSQELTQQFSVIQLKDEEIKKLRESLRHKTNSPCDEDFEIRIKSLTDTLMIKQNNLEAVTSERNALKIQLERLENEYHNNLTRLERAQVRVVNVNDTDDIKSQLPNFMRVSPSDAGVTRRFKHAYSTVDAISVRTGRFLRRYPLARVLVFCYMVLLHFWVLIILIWYVDNM